MAGRGGFKKTSTSLSTVPSTNVRISQKNFLTFIFNTFAILVSKFKIMSSALLSLNQEHPSKKKFSGQTLIKLRL